MFAHFLVIYRVVLPRIFIVWFVLLKTAILDAQAGAGFFGHRVGGQSKIYKTVIGGLCRLQFQLFFDVAGSCAGGANLIVYTS